MHVTQMLRSRDIQSVLSIEIYMSVTNFINNVTLIELSCLQESSFSPVWLLAYPKMNSIRHFSRFRDLPT